MKKTFLIAILILTLTLAISSSSYVEDTSIQLTGLKHSSQAWGDFNLDGNWDLAICGEANNPKTIIYEFNSNGQPIQKDFEIINVTRCSINWADINNNGWDDLTISGINHDGIFLKIYKNINGTKFQEYQNLTGVAYSNTLYGDLNNNGWLDLVAIGCNEVHNATPTKNIHNCNKIISRVYINNNGTLEYSEQWSSNLANVWKGSIALGDYTNNGFLDLALSGTTTNTSSGAITHLYMNNGTTFNLDENNILEGIFWGSLAFSDYNNNGNLDLFITGRNSSGQPITKIFQNDVHIYKNHSMPIPPTDIKLDVNDGKIHVSWNTEQEEPLSFNLKAYYYRYQVGTSTIIDTKYAVSPLYPISSNPSQGYFGNMLNKQSYRFDSPNRCTYVQIQTVDASMRKSEWSEPVNISFTSNRGSGYDEDCRGSDQPTIAQLGGGGGGTQVEAYQEYIRAEEERRAQEELTPFETDQTSRQESSSSPGIERPEDFSMVQQEISIEQILDESLKLETMYDYIDGNTRITYIAKNLGIFDREIELQIDIPKDLAENADEIIQITPFNIIEYNPVIGFNATISPLKDAHFQYSVKGRLSDEDIARITTKIITDQEKDRMLMEQFQRKVEETRRAITVTQELVSDFKRNQTTITLDIDINKTVRDTGRVSIFQEIPKCLVEIINEQMIDAKNLDFEIINVDPLIVWHFESILDIKKIQYTINAVADQDCTDQLMAMAVASQIILASSEINFFKLWMAVSIIPIIALIMIIFGIITAKIEHEDAEINKITQYIREHYRQGYNKLQLKEKLLKEGYHEHAIEQCLNLHTKSKFHYLLHKLEVGFDELILSILIVLNILDFFEFLPGDVYYLKMIISWVLLSYVLYKVSITKILFGTQKKFIDTALIIAFFSLTLKNIIAFAKVSWQDVNLVYDLYNFLILNNIIFERYVFIAGIIAIIIISIYISFKVPIKSPCFLTALHIKDEQPKNKLLVIWRMLCVHVVLLGFFVLIFNLMMEWLAIAVDALIIVLTLTIMIFLVIKHHEKLGFAKFMEMTSSSAEKFYEKFIDLFHYKKTIYLGISGMLILHALTDIGNFIIPYLTGIKNPMYFGNLAYEQMPLFSFHESSLFVIQTAGASLSTKLHVISAYLLNVIAIIFLLIIPALIWFHYFKNRNLPILEIKKFRITKNHLVNSILFGVFASSLFIVLTRPIFRIKQILGGENIVGVNITTSMIALENLGNMLLAALAIGAFAFTIAYFFEKIINTILFPITYGFFGYYIFLFGNSVFVHNLNEFSTLIEINTFIAFYTLIMAILALGLLYSGGFLIATYLYLPEKLKLAIAKIPLINKLFEKHNFHHIQHYNKHDENKHSSKEIALKEYILKSLNSGHELFYAVENLVESGWPVEIIEKAIDMVKHDESYQEEIKHIKHFHQNKDKISNLARWILNVYPRYKLKLVIDVCLEKGWSEDDIILAFKLLNNKIKISEKDKEVFKHMQIIK